MLRLGLKMEEKSMRVSAPSYKRHLKEQHASDKLCQNSLEESQTSHTFVR